MNGEQQITIDELAVMIQKGFESTASKTDIERLEKRMDKFDERMDSFEGRLNYSDARLGRIEADISEMRGELVYRHEFEDVLGRIKYLERKLGIESGV